MSYTVGQDGIVTLDTGQRISVTATRERLSNGCGVAFTASATWVDASNNVQTDSSGPVASETTFTADQATVASQTEDGLAKALLLTVLGEPQSVIAFSDDYKANVSIRNHIAMATAPALNPVSLLG